MTALPILLSVPHAGLVVPDRFADRFLLSPEQVAADGDEFADRFWLPLADRSTRAVTTEVARAVVDVNRRVDDRRDDGVVKAVSIFGDPVWREPLAAADVAWLIEHVHRPYHEALDRSADAPGVRFAVDGHTMAAVGPPVGPDPGARRPAICVGTVGGRAFPAPDGARLATCLRERLAAAGVDDPREVTIDAPFGGGWITQRLAARLPTVQIEVSRGVPLAPEVVAAVLGDALAAFVGGA